MAEEKTCCFFPVVNRGCCCDLKTCCQWFAWLTLIGAAIVIGADAYEIDHVISPCDKTQGQCAPKNAKVVVPILAFDICIQAVYGICSVLFLCGISENEPGKLLPFIYMIRGNLVFKLIQFVVLLPVAQAAIGVLIVAPLGIYICVCTGSLYVHMKAGSLANQYYTP